ncbi:MAG: hypothetical protein KBT03_03305 [Bacteroidales bacterium]|nr:hypothetical protein [Candidatus Scybalousia scybalohippi]
MTQIREPLATDKTLSQGLTAINAKLEVIAIVLGQKYSTSWANVQNIIQEGKGPEIYPVGTQFTVHHQTIGDIVLDVVAHNYNKNSAGVSVPSMTLLAHDRIKQLQFDQSEAFYYAEDGLSAGTYHFTIATSGSWAAGTYQFTLTQDLEAGGVLLFSGNSGTALTSLKVNARSSRSSTTNKEQCTITEGSGGTELTDLNNLSRVSYGSNNYAQSALRQWLNSEGNVGFWQPQTIYDVCPSWLNSENGFLQGLPAEFKSVIQPSLINCRTNTVYEREGYNAGNNKYTLADKVWLPSMTEVGLGGDSVEDTTIFPYYVGATDTDRIKYAIGTTSAGIWWLRSPSPSVAYSVRVVNSSGALSDYTANYTIGVVPAFVIY